MANWMTEPLQRRSTPAVMTGAKKGPLRQWAKEITPKQKARCSVHTLTGQRPECDEILVILCDF